MIIAISGKMGSGKSTLADGLEQWARLNKKGITVTRLKFADPIYEAARSSYTALGLEPLKDRKLLQFMGAHFKEKFGPSFWTDQIRDRINNLTFIGDNLIIIDDLRFPNEAEFVKSLGGTVIRLECPDEERLQRIGNMLFVNTAHESETALDSYTGFDYKLNSDVMTTAALIKVVTTNLWKLVK